MPRIMKSLNNISRCQAIYRSNNLECDGICPVHHTFIFAICRNPGSSQEELAQEICISKSTVTRTLGYLEERGYITRKATPKDKRQFEVYPTEKMLAILPRICEISQEWNRLISEGVSEEEMAVFDSVLKRMEESAKRLADGRNAK